MLRFVQSPGNGPRDKKQWRYLRYIHCLFLFLAYAAGDDSNKRRVELLALISGIVDAIGLN